MDVDAATYQLCGLENASFFQDLICLTSKWSFENYTRHGHSHSGGLSRCPVHVGDDGDEGDSDAEDKEGAGLPHETLT